MIKSGGEWISSVQLEGIIMGHPQVLEAAVVGLPHPKWQERPVAIVVPKPEAAGDLTPEIIEAYLQDKEVAKWWLPDRIIMDTRFPRPVWASSIRNCCGASSPGRSPWETVRLRASGSGLGV